MIWRESWSRRYNEGLQKESDMEWPINTLLIVQRNFLDIKTEVKGRTKKNKGRNEYITTEITNIRLSAWNRICFEVNIHTGKRPHRLRASSDSYSMAVPILFQEQNGRGTMLTAQLV